MNTTVRTGPVDGSSTNSGDDEHGERRDGSHHVLRVFSVTIVVTEFDTYRRAR